MGVAFVFLRMPGIAKAKNSLWRKNVGIEGIKAKRRYIWYLSRNDFYSGKAADSRGCKATLFL